MINVERYIPLDKSWLIRMGILDMFGSKTRTRDMLRTTSSLCDDLKVLRHVISVFWETNSPVWVGNSATIYRILQYTSWKMDVETEFLCSPQLEAREITQDPSIVFMSQEELLKLDHGTSQWATAAALYGDHHRVDLPPFKLALTYEAIDLWHTSQGEQTERFQWKARLDMTIYRQAQHFVDCMLGNKPRFPQWTFRQDEDFCFGYFFGFLSVAEGEKLWPSLAGHESNRLVEVVQTQMEINTGNSITTDDHRVLQAAVMWASLNKVEIDVRNPSCVGKSWPLFWDFLEEVEQAREK